jgi:hypothetical protein
LRQQNPPVHLAKVEKLRQKIPLLNAVEYENTESDLCFYSFFNTRCHDLSYSRDNEDCAYLFEGVKCKSTADGNLPYQTQMAYEISNSDFVTYSGFMVDCSRTHFSYFCNYCNDCSYCFGCVGLEFKEYHVLNKPYSKEEYFYRVEQLLKKFQEQKIPVTEMWYKIWSLEAAQEKTSVNLVD